MLHIYTETMQPATGWIDTHSGEPMQMGYEPEKLIYTDCCGQRRPAKDCMVQCYYDGLSVWCAPEKGCKDPQVIEEKKAPTPGVKVRSRINPTGTTTRTST